MTDQQAPDRATRETVTDCPPTVDHVTDYDLAHAKQYLRLLDAHKEGADWQEAATIVLGLDCERDPENARRIHTAHCERARWMTREGWKDLLAKAHPR